MAIFLSYELGFSARFSSAKLHKIVDTCKKNCNYFIDNQIFILNFSIDYIVKSLFLKGFYVISGVELYEIRITPLAE